MEVLVLGIMIFALGAALGVIYYASGLPSKLEYDGAIRQRDEANRKLTEFNMILRTELGYSKVDDLKEKLKLVEYLQSENKSLLEQRNKFRRDCEKAVELLDENKKALVSAKEAYDTLYKQAEEAIKILSKQLEEAKETHSSIRRKLREELDAEYKERLEREAEAYNNQVRYTNTLLTKISELQTELAKYTAASERAAVIRRVKTRESKVS